MADSAKNDSLEALFDEGALILNDDTPIEETLPGTGKTPTTPLQGTDLAAVVDGGNGEVSRDSTPSQGVHVLFTNAGCGAAPSDREELEMMDTSTCSGRNWADIISEESDEEIPPGQPRVDPPDLHDRLMKCLSRKRYLREKLIRSEHHREYLDDHHRHGIVPKGLQLERKFNPLTVDGYKTATASQIEDILSQAERKIHRIMLDHHKKLTKVINRKLEAVEEKIGGITHHPEASTAIRKTLMKETGVMERQENSLTLALQRSRRRKSSKELPAGPPRGSRNTTPLEGNQKTTTGPVHGDHSTSRRGRGKDKRQSKPYKRPEPRSGDKSGRPGKGPRSGPSRGPRAPHTTSGATREASMSKKTPPPPPITPPLRSSTPLHPHLPTLPLPSPIFPAGPRPGEDATPQGASVSGFMPYAAFPAYPYPAYPMAPHPQGYPPPHYYGPVPPPSPSSRDPALIKEIVQEVVSQLQLHTSTVKNRNPPLTTRTDTPLSGKSTTPSPPLSPSPHNTLEISKPLYVEHSQPLRFEHPHPLDVHNMDKLRHTNIINLSGKKLSRNAYSVLTKGLSFIPTPYIHNTSKMLLKDLEEFKSKYIDTWLERVPHRAKRILKKTMTNIKYDFCGCSPMQVGPNLSRGERQALRQLRKDKSLIVSKADKGDVVVVLSTSAYIELVHQHLNDRETYKLLQHDPTEEIVTQFTEYLKTCKERGVITTLEYHKLIPTDKVDTQRIYFLPKIHKNPLKLRPIVSCTNGPTQKASAFLDKLLQPYMKRVKSYLRNSTDLIRILQSLIVPTHAYLITLDIESLYTNISHEEAILSFLRIFKHHPKKVFLLDLLKYVLKNNVFTFDDLTFTQLCGVAMGTRLAPALATIYIGDIEEAYIQTRDKKPLLWVRYIDDIFTIWTHSLHDFEEFLEELNQVHPKIHFTAKTSSYSCDFLDLTIYKSPTFVDTGILSTKIYYKPSNTFSFPLGSSYMSHSIHKGIAIGELTRLIRNTTSPVLFEYYKRKLINRFRHRRYAKNIIKILKKMDYTTRQSLLTTKKIRNLERSLPFTTKFNRYNHSLQRILRNRWSAIYNDKHLFPLFPNSPFTVYKNHKTLKTILSYKRRQFNSTPKLPNLQRENATPFEFLKFNHPRPLRT